MFHKNVKIDDFSNLVEKLIEPNKKGLEKYKATCLIKNILFIQTNRFEKYITMIIVQLKSNE